MILAFWDRLVGKTHLRTLNRELAQAVTALRGEIVVKDRMLDSYKLLVSALRDVNAELDRAAQEK